MVKASSLFALVLALGACDGTSGSERLEARLSRIGDGYQLTLNNGTNADACFPSTFFPSDTNPAGFTIFDAEGAVRHGPIFEPVMGRLPARRLQAHSRERIALRFPQGVEVGDCVLLELFYCDCAEQDEFSAGEGVENPTLLQTAWQIGSHTVTNQPDLASSCVPARVLHDSEFGG
jgi:hypothetical protein